MENELIGKKIYKTSHYGIDSIFGKVERVTKTTLICRNHKFRIDNLSLIGESSWSLYGYELETIELNEQWEKKQLFKEILSKISTYNYEDKLSLEDVKNAHALLINIKK